MTTVMALLVIVIGDAAAAGAAGAAMNPKNARLPMIGAEMAEAMRAFLFMRACYAE
jgi:hypothetical protein